MPFLSPNSVTITESGITFTDLLTPSSLRVLPSFSWPLKASDYLQGGSPSSALCCQYLKNSAVKRKRTKDSDYESVPRVKVGDSTDRAAFCHPCGCQQMENQCDQSLTSLALSAPRDEDDLPHRRSWFHASTTLIYVHYYYYTARYLRRSVLQSVLSVCVWVCYHDNSKLCASILAKLGL